MFQNSQKSSLYEIFNSVAHNHTYGHPFLVILGPTTRFWVEQEMGGVGQKFFAPKTLPYQWVTTVVVVFSMKAYS